MATVVKMSPSLPTKDFYLLPWGKVADPVIWKLPARNSSFMESEAQLSWKIKAKECPGLPAAKGS